MSRFRFLVREVRSGVFEELGPHPHRAGVPTRLRRRSDKELEMRGIIAVAPSRVPAGLRSTGYRFERVGGRVVQIHDGYLSIRHR